MLISSVSSRAAAFVSFPVAGIPFSDKGDLTYSWCCMLVDVQFSVGVWEASQGPHCLDLVSRVGKYGGLGKSCER